LSCSFKKLEGRIQTAFRNSTRTLAHHFGKGYRVNFTNYHTHGKEYTVNGIIHLDVEVENYKQTDSDTKCHILQTYKYIPYIGM